LERREASADIGFDVHLRFAAQSAFELKHQDIVRPKRQALHILDIDHE
jgi:hypothetical protein